MFALGPRIDFSVVRVPGVHAPVVGAAPRPVVSTPGLSVRLETPAQWHQRQRRTIPVHASGKNASR